MSKKKKAPVCPKCGTVATKSMTAYGPRYDHCGLYAWGRHPLVSRETHQARKAAHAAFDPVWQLGVMDRASAYKALAERLGIERHACHMKLMDEATARRVPAIAAEMRRAP